MRQWQFAMAAAGILGFAAGVQAEVKTVAQYRLGDSDPGAAPGKPAQMVTADEAKPGRPMSLTGKTQYIGLAGAPQTLSRGSTLCATFDGKSFYRRTGLSTPNHDNFGIEAYVKAATDEGFGAAVSWGAGTHGFSLVRNNKGYQVLLGGVNLVGWSGDVPAAQWAHLAVVRDNGKTTFYFNGNPCGDTTAAPNPVGANDGFAVGASGDGKDNLFRGEVDEVRVFTFQPGRFQVSDLLYRK